MKKKHILSIFAILMTALLLFSGVGWAAPAQHDNPAAPGPTPAEYGIISGRVICYAGYPVAGALIGVGDPATGAHGLAGTDHDGHYIITDLAVGTYKMVVFPPGALSPAFILNITVIAGETTIVNITLKDIPPDEGGIISGRVTCYAGYPVADTFVIVWDPVTHVLVGYTGIDRYGYYALTGLAAGIYKMMVIFPLEEVNIVSLFITDIMVIANETTTVDVTLKLPGDVNRDGKVDGADLAAVAAAFNSRTGWPNWNPAADLNHDGIVDIFDLVQVGINFGKSSNPGD